MSYSVANPEKQKIVDQIQSMLEEFLKKHTDIDGQMVFKFPESVPIASTWQGVIDPILVGALSSAVKITFANLVKHLHKGDLTAIYVNSEFGRTIIENAGPKAILCTVMSHDIDVNRVAFIASDLAKKIERTLKDF